MQRKRATHADAVGIDAEGIWRDGKAISTALAVLLILVGTANAIAQNLRETWTTDNGLPQNSVTGLTQTPDGYLWFTTNDGLVRFDGVHFKVFNKSNTPEITTNRMSGAFADKSGKLWVHTEDGGALFYEKGIFNRLQPQTLLPHHLTQPTGPFNLHRPDRGFVQLHSFRSARRIDTSHLRKLESCQP